VARRLQRARRAWESHHADSAGIRGATGHPLVETEDIVPLPMIVAAAQKYVREVCGAS